MRGGFGFETELLVWLEFVLVEDEEQSGPVFVKMFVDLRRLVEIVFHLFCDDNDYKLKITFTVRLALACSQSRLGLSLDF